jgi:hypothetical protein
MKPDAKSYIVSECREDEECIAIVPSERVGAGAFLSVLGRNGIGTRALGIGTGTVLDAAGSHLRVPGVVVVAIARTDEKRVRTHARMCGVAIARIEVI